MMQLFQTCIAAILLLMSADCFAASEAFILAKSGKAKAVIVCSPDAIPAEKTAANELSAFLKQITSAQFPVVVSDKAYKDVQKIYVGQSETTRRMLGIKDWKSLKSDGIAIKFVGNDIVIAGDRPRGTLYAVYTFLEDYCGCKWWTPSASTIPNNRNLSIKPANKTYIPPFFYRETFYRSVVGGNVEFATRLKLNGHYQPIPDTRGAHYMILGFCHTMPWLLPASTYFKDHPEWFAMVNGKRSPDNTQPCLTNMEMKDELVKQAMKLIEKDQWAGMISISQTDGGIPCQCEKCQAIVKEEGSESGPLIRFVNEVAEDIDKKYPGFLVETLAYTFSRKPPKHVKPRENVIIRLCSIEGDFAKPLNSETNKSFYEDLQGWSKITDRLFVWDYVVNFWNGLVAFPNWHVLGPNIRLFRQNKVIGLFEQGDGFNNDATFAHMKTWVLAKLMWNPDLDTHKLMMEFAKGYYGKAGPHLVKYLEATSNVIVKNNVYMNAFNKGDVSHFNQKDMDYFSSCFDRAEKAVEKDPVLLSRVSAERKCLDHMWLLLPLYDRSKAFGKRKPDLPKIAEDFIEYSISTGNDYVVEGQRMTDEYKQGLRNLAVMPPMPKGTKNITPPKQVSGLSNDRWIDFQEDKYTFSRPGFFVFATEDKAASDGRALYMPASHTEWAIQLGTRHLKELEKSKFSIWVSVKAKPKAKTGRAILMGVIDTKTTVQVNRQEIAIENLKSDGYAEYCLGTYDYNPNLVAWVAPCANPTDMDSVYVDRFFIIKEK